MIRLTFLLILALAAIPALAQTIPGMPVDSAYADTGNPSTGTCLRNPDGRTNLTVTLGIGMLDGLSRGDDADLQAVGLALVYPATNDLSLLARYDHSDADWNGVTSKWLTNWRTNVYTVGLRYYFGK